MPGAVYNAASGGLLIDGTTTIDKFVGTGSTADAATALAGVGITPGAESPYLDLGALVSTLDPTGGFFGHDKVEGVATKDGGKTIVVSNDNDFGIVGVNNTPAPYQLTPKILPNGQQDDGEYLAIDTTKLPAGTSTATVSILVL